MLNDLAAKKEELENTSQWIEKLGWIFGVFVTIGVAGETYVGIRALINASRSRSVQKQIDQQHELESQKMQMSIADANKRAAEANERADKLEYTNSQRVIPPEMRQAMVAALSKFSGQRFQVLSKADDESLSFSKSVSQALQTCGWVPENVTVKYEGVPEPNAIIGPHFSLLYNPDSDRSPIDALTKFFPVGILSGSKQVPVGTIVVVVMPKPPHPATIDTIVQQMGRRSPLFDNVIDWSMDLRQYAGQNYSVYSLSGDAASERWRVDLFSGLTMAGWHLTNEPIGESAVYPVDFEKMLIAVNSEEFKSGRIPVGATALLEKLKAIGILPTSNTIRPMADVRVGELRVRIGVNPPLSNSEISQPKD